MTENEWESVNNQVKSRYEIPSVRRSGQILLVLASADHALRMSELSKILSLPKATVFRIVQTLEIDGFVERLDGDRYRIGHAAFEVGRGYVERLDLQSAFRHVAQKLVDEHNETVQLAMLVGNDVLYIAKEDSSQPVRLASNVGMRLPASATSLGKAMLSCFSDDQIRALFQHEHLIQMTPNGHATLSALIQEIEGIRERGWAHDNEEVAIGLQCVASPILDRNGSNIAGISIAVPTHRMVADRLSILGETVKLAAHEIETLLSYVD